MAKYIERKSGQIIMSDGYLLRYEKRKNKITITLPQTFGSLTNSTEKISRRRTDLSTSELALILYITMLTFERTEDDG